MTTQIDRDTFEARLVIGRRDATVSGKSLLTRLRAGEPKPTGGPVPDPLETSDRGNGAGLAKLVKQVNRYLRT